MITSTRHAVALALGFLCPYLVSAQTVEKYEIRPRARVGLTVEFSGLTEVWVSAEGKRALLGKVEGRFTVRYTAVENGLPAACEATYTKLPEETAGTPNPLVGQTFLVRRSANTIVIENREGLLPEIADGLKAALDIAGMYPPSAVAIGEEWKGKRINTPAALAELGVGSVDFTSKLVRVGEVKGRLVYYVAQTLSFKGLSKDGKQFNVEGDGLSHLDAETGMVLRSGGTVRISVREGEKSGTMEIRAQVEGVIRSEGADVAPAASPVAAHPLAQPPVNPLARPVPNPFAGSFKGDELSAEFVSQGTKITGTISKGGSGYPVTGNVDGTTLRGTFLASGVEFKFEAVIDGDLVTLISDGNSYTMRKR